MLIGTVDYMAGNVAKNLVDEVFLSVGFRSHSSSSELDKVTQQAVVGPAGVSTSTTTETYSGTSVAYDFAKLLKLSETWPRFFGL